VDIERIRADFPILQQRIHGHPLIYLDNAATTQKPRQVLDTLHTFYTAYNANIHRSPHHLGQAATALYEQAHRNVARFIGAADWREIIFTRNTTEAVNLIAHALAHAEAARLSLRAGDRVVITIAEHHSNLVPWQMTRDLYGIELRFADIHGDGTLDLDHLSSLLSERTKLVACAHVSNVLGTVNPVRDIARLAHEAGALLLVDGAQSVPHLPVDVGELGCDLLCFSGHKMLAPMGIGVLYGKRQLLDEMSPFLCGGEMIEEVTLDRATWNRLPWKFEAGTPNVAGAVALGGATDPRNGLHLMGAMDYLSEVGMDAMREHEVALNAHLLQGLRAMPEVQAYGPGEAKARGGVVSFAVRKHGEPVDAHLVAQLLDQYGIAVRAGGHCAYPLADRLGVVGTIRASVYVYNTLAEIDRFLSALHEIIEHRLL
jgi:cysteine desulfurase/selenocysteine lyase